MKETNNNRRDGNNIIIGQKDGKISYWNWHADGMIEEKANATGYHNKRAANYVIDQLSTEIPGYTWTTELDN